MSEREASIDFEETHGRPMTAAERSARFRAKQKAAIAAGDIPPPVLSEARVEQLRTARRRYRHSELGREIRKAEKRQVTERRPFVGVDGEGAGTDELGRQLYMLLRAGEHELFTGRHLTTAECLEHIASLPDGPIYVGFSFGYDVTMILRDLPKERLDQLFAKRERGPGKSPYTWFGLYGVEYLPKNYIRVCRGEYYRTRNGGRWVRTIPGTARTIYETFSFFQMSFLKSIKAFGVGTQAEWDRIDADKARRGDEDWTIGDRERAYCAEECDLLAQMMQRFRESCYAADIRPREWSGAGKISEALLKREKVIGAKDVAALVPADVLTMAGTAYYGGRFEVTRIGEIPGPVYEYDLHSAYPSAYQHVPCLEHGRFHSATGKELAQLGDETLWIGPVHFKHKPPKTGSRRLNVCGLPMRLKTGRICWPAEGNGTYWSTEIASARALGAVVKPTGAGWRYEARCDCKPLKWVAGLYDHRKALQADASLGGKVAGHPLKLGMNGCYGKLCQKVGAAPWQNLIWAGLITAWCRAQLNRAAASDPDAVVMMATDGIFATRPLAVDIGDELGKWETVRHDRLFVVQPGIYWGGVTRSKTRGVDPSFFADKTGIFEGAWQSYAERDRAAHKGAPNPPPRVPLPVTLFTGLKLAYSRGKPETAGRWTRSAKDCPHTDARGQKLAACKCRNFDFDWHGKRGRHVWQTEHCAWTYPQAGGPDMKSYPHRGDKEVAQAHEAMDIDRTELDDQPDHFDLSPPGRD